MGGQTLDLESYIVLEEGEDTDGNLIIFRDITNLEDFDLDYPDLPFFS